MCLSGYTNRDALAEHSDHFLAGNKTDLITLFHLPPRCSYFFTQKQRLKAHRSRYSDKFLTHKLQYFSTKNALVVHIEGTCLYNILMQHCDPKFSKATLPWMFFGLCTQNLGGNTEYRA